MKNKASFTLIELIIVIVIMGVLSNITFDILSKLYINYTQTKELNKLTTKLDAAMEIIASRLRDRVRNSVIATKYPLKRGESDASKVDFKPLSRLEDGDDEYKILEWINKDFEAKNGMWNDNSKHIQTGWSGFIDLGYNSHKVSDNPKEFNISSPNSDFNIVSLIDRNITTSLGFNEDPFETNTTVLIFSGNDMGGDLIDDINQSYGWYLDKSKNRNAKVVYGILDYEDYLEGTDMKISSISENNDSVLYSRYYLARTAYALVPIENNGTGASGGELNDYNLTFYYNYQPWQGDWWNGTHGDSNSTLLVDHVTEIRFKKDVSSPIIRLYICVQSPDIIIDKRDENNKDDDRYLTLCKEKAIF